MRMQRDANSGVMVPPMETKRNETWSLFQHRVRREATQLKSPTRFLVVLLALRVFSADTKRPARTSESMEARAKLVTKAKKTTINSFCQCTSAVQSDSHTRERKESGGPPEWCGSAFFRLLLVEPLVSFGDGKTTF